MEEGIGIWTVEYRITTNLHSAKSGGKVDQGRDCDWLDHIQSL